MSVAEFLRLHPEEDPIYKYEHMSEFERKREDEITDAFMWHYYPELAQAMQNLTEEVEQDKREEEIMKKVRATTPKPKTAKVISFPGKK